MSDISTPLEELAKLLKDQRARWRKWFLGIGLLILALVVGQVRTQHVATEAQHAAVDAGRAAAVAQAATDQLLAQRTEARLNSCTKDKKFADAHNGLILYFANAKPNPADVRTASQRTERAALILDFETKNLVPVPDCSPAGIAAFYAGHGGTTTVNPQAPNLPTTTTARPAPRTTTTTVSPSTSTSGTTSTTVYPSPTPTSLPQTCLLAPVTETVPLHC